MDDTYEDQQIVEFVFPSVYGALIMLSDSFQDFFPLCWGFIELVCVSQNLTSISFNSHLEIVRGFDYSCRKNSLVRSPTKCSALRCV